MTLNLKRFLPLLIALSAAMTLAVTHVPAASAFDPCDGSDPPPSCFETHTETFSRTLTVNRSIGAVTSNPSGISCGATCSASYVSSRECDAYDCSEWDTPTVTLTATGGPAGYSPSWSGCTPSGATCTATMDVNHTVALTWLDTTPPSVSFNPPTKVGPSSYNVSASGSDNSGSFSYRWWINGSSQGATGSVLSLSSLPEGVYTVSVLTQDASGYQSAPVTKSVTVDKHTSMTVGAIAADVASIPSVAIATDADATAKCAVDGGALSSCASGWKPASLDEGDHTYSVTAIDDVGNTATQTRSFTYDPTAPTLSITGGPADGATIDVRTATVAFAAADPRLSAVTCRVDGGAAAPCAGSVTLTDLADGAHSVTVAATDRAGNRTERTRSFTVKVPVAATDTGTGGSTGGGSAAAQQPAAGPQATAPQTTAPQTPAAPHASLVAKSHRKGAATVFTTLRLTSVPAGARVTVSCKGKGCPRKPAKLASLLGRRLEPGTVITIRVGAAQTIKVSVRRGATPKIG